MAQVFAGFVCGYGLALAVTPVMAIALVRARASSTLVRRAVPEQSSLIAVAFIIHTFAFFALTAVGIIMGLVLNGLDQRSPDGGLGSPNRAFAAFVLVTTAIAVAPLALVVPRWRLPLILGAVVFAGTFGWLMPHLSLLAPEG